MLATQSQSSGSSSQLDGHFTPAEITKLSIYNEHRKENIEASMIEHSLQSLRNWTGRASAHVLELKEKVSRFTVVKNEMDILNDQIIRTENKLKFEEGQIHAGQVSFGRESKMQAEELMLKKQGEIDKNINEESSELKNLRVGQIIESMNAWSSRASEAALKLRSLIEQYAVLKKRKQDLMDDIKRLEASLQDTSAMIKTKRSAIGVEVQDIAKNMLVDEERLAQSIRESDETSTDAAFKRKMMGDYNGAVSRRAALHTNKDEDTVRKEFGISRNPIESLTDAVEEKVIGTSGAFETSYDDNSDDEEEMLARDMIAEDSD